MTKTLLILLLLTLPTCGECLAQGVRYAYDAGGNRTAREIVLDDPAMVSQDVSGRLSSSEVIIHPNPTEDALVVEIRNFYKASPVYCSSTPRKAR